MNRPYVICHMLQSIDGKIAGGFFREKETTKLAKIYSEISTNYDGDAIIYGKTTALELFSLTHLNKSSNITYNLTDHVYQKENKKWLVVIDLKGEIAWDSSIYKNRRLQDKNLIVILSEAISNQYLELLKKLNISSFCRKKEISLKSSLRKSFMIYVQLKSSYYKVEVLLISSLLKKTSLMN